ncbi:MAG: hypothetical protein AWL62_1708 [Halanaerobium sp. T82-1]|nr:MAG: hypothetical protein AWL62_1708 [Halanaerobium sp. T82-1]
MKLSKDWLEFFKDDDFQQDLVFLSIISLIYFFNLIEKSSFDMLMSIIIAGDAVKKLGRGKQ